MKTYLPYLLAAAGAFVLWQWWQAGPDNELRRQERNRAAADQAGKAQEKLALAGRPRLMSDERIADLERIMAGNNPLWSQIFDDGSAVNGDKVSQPPQRNPFLFGFLTP